MSENTDGLASGVKKKLPVRKPGWRVRYLDAQEEAQMAGTRLPPFPQWRKEQEAKQDQ